MKRLWECYLPSLSSCSTLHHPELPLQRIRGFVQLLFFFLLAPCGKWASDKCGQRPSVSATMHRLVWRRDIITNKRIKTWGDVRQKQADGLVWGVSDGNMTTQRGAERGGKRLGTLGAFWVGVMTTENKNATVVRPPLRPASNYTHTHTYT